MDRERFCEALKKAVEFSFSRSSGAGGQNVNKVNTKVRARLKLEGIEGLSEEDLVLLKTRLAGRMNGLGELVIHVQDTRSQALNREIAEQRLCGIVLAALERPRVRKPTRATKASRERRLEAKRLVSTKKRERRPDFD